MTKLCVNCKWHNRIVDDWCENPTIAGECFIDGEVGALLCISARNDTRSCGVGAKYFEQKLTLWQKLKGFFK